MRLVGTRLGSDCYGRGRHSPVERNPGGKGLPPSTLDVERWMLNPNRACLADLSRRSLLAKAEASERVELRSKYGLSAIQAVAES
jgi:hypothetical protein